MGEFPQTYMIADSHTW